MDDKKKKPSISEKLKEGVSMHEIETLARKYTIEAFVILAIIIATISSTWEFFIGAGWSLFFAGLGAIIGIALPEGITKMEKLYFNFIYKQEKPAQIAIGIVQIVIALFIPLIIFIQIGLLSGMSFHHFSRLPIGNREKESAHKSERDEEHP